ncbi:MAG: hypothetical protein KF810_23370 [Rhizobiaceae bacterium]|nr:hypothetical protein [Rhizobiaceae bacterium]
MTTITEKEFNRSVSPRTTGRFPRIALRQRSADHPMILFLAIVVTALIAMALMPPSGVAMSTFQDAPAAAAADSDTADGPVSVSLSELEIACHGQAWGAESAECIAEIASESGRPDGRPVRVIAGS